MNQKTENKLKKIILAEENGDFINVWYTDEKIKDIEIAITHNIATFDNKEDYEEYGREG